MTRQERGGGLDPAELREPLRAAAARLIESGVAPGVVLGVDVAGTRAVEALGPASPELELPMTRHTLHDLASVTKVVGTTAAIMRLVALGALTLDARVAAVLPSSPCAPDTTVRDLLRHRGGLWEWQPLYLGAMRDPDDAVDRLPLRYAPGSRTAYSDLGFMLLGRVISRVTSLPLDRAIAELVTIPAGLQTMAYRSAHRSAELAELADCITTSQGDAAERTMVTTGVPYPILDPAETGLRAESFPWRRAAIRGEANDGNCFHAFQGIAGHAGLFATVDDLLDAATAISGGRGDELYPAALRAECFAAGPDTTQALGWRRAQLTVGHRPEPFLYHTGFTGTAVGCLPASGTTFALSMNRLLSPHGQSQPVATHLVRFANTLTSTLHTQE